MRRGAPVQDRATGPSELIAADIIHQFFRFFSGVAVVDDTKSAEDNGNRQEKQQFHGQDSL